MTTLSSIDIRSIGEYDMFNHRSHRVTFRHVFFVALFLASAVVFYGICQSQTAMATALAKPIVASNLAVLTPAPDSAFGVEFDWSWSENYNGYAQAAKDAGFKWTRFGELKWSQIESTPGVYNWNSQFESNLAALPSGLTPIVIIHGTPGWAQLYAGSECGPIKADKFQNFANFVKAAVQRYSVPPYNVKYWEIWNEPDAAQHSGNDGFGCWGNPSDPNFGGGYFADMLKVVQPKIKQADPNAKIILGGLLLSCGTSDPAGGAFDCLEEPNSPEFLKGILANGGAPYFDIVAFHGYPYWIPPNVPGAETVKDWDVYYSQGRYTSSGGLLLAKLDFIRGMLGDYNALDKPIIMNESSLLCRWDYSYAPYGSNLTWDQNCAGGSLNYQGTPGVSNPAFYSAQANFAFRLFPRLWGHGISNASWYTLYNAWYDGGLMSSGPTPRQAYNALKFEISELNGATFGGILSKDNYEGYRFCKGNIEYRLYWTNVDGDTAPLPAPTSGISKYDIYGNVWTGGNTIQFNPVMVKKDLGTACTIAAFWNFDTNRNHLPLLDNGSDPTTVARYASGPCQGKVAGACHFDTRTETLDNSGNRLESITAYGKFWNYDKDHNYNLVSTGDLTTVSRYVSSGRPCYGKTSGTCKFDTRTVYTASNGHRIESITAYGKYWNFDISNNQQLLSSGDLTTLGRYTQSGGPCYGKTAGTCKFDTLTFVTWSDGHLYESITAYGKYWNFDYNNNYALISTGDLTSVPRYANFGGPCYGKTPGTCTFDTRSMMTANGTIYESIYR
jgi:hypothetical protein